MRHLIFNPAIPRQRLPFYLATEEFVADNRLMQSEPVLFTWRVAPTVIFGRNQQQENEVNIKYCRENGIEMYRRKSGGGCVYADMGNIMFSYIEKSADVNNSFGNFTSAITNMLRSLGLNAATTGRNDVTIDGKKVSGTAFYHKAGAGIVHGTMLFSTDMPNMLNAITPSTDKLNSRGVKSVASRVTTIDSYLKMSVDEFENYAINYLCDGDLQLDSAQVGRIHDIESHYYQPQFISGNNPRATVTYSCRFEGVGEICANIELRHGVIRNINFAGDYFLLADIDSAIVKPLIGLPLDYNIISDTIKDIDTASIVRNLSPDQLLRLLFQKRQ